LTGNPTFRVVNERPTGGTLEDSSYQFRVEETSSGPLQNYLINVLQARDASGPDVMASLTLSGTTWTIGLDHPTLGHAVVQLNQGAASAGGMVGYSPSAVPTGLTPLLDHVQTIRVDDSGPVWGG